MGAFTGASHGKTIMNTSDYKPSEILGLLVELNRLNSSPGKDSDEETGTRIKEILATLPPELRSHHNNLTRMNNDRKSIAPLRSGTCGNCFLSVPKADRFSIEYMREVVICHNCSVVLYPEGMPFEPAPRAEAET